MKHWRLLFSIFLFAVAGWNGYLFVISEEPHVLALTLAVGAVGAFAGGVYLAAWMARRR